MSATDREKQPLSSKDIHNQSCPCCSGKLLRQIDNRGIYWFCSRCRQEMPNFN
jgi:ribosomal protein L37AE/L43A